MLHCDGASCKSRSRHQNSADRYAFREVSFLYTTPINSVRHKVLEIRAVLFDKDGTLFEFGRTWETWVEGVLSEMAAGDLALRSRLAEAGGFDIETREFIVGSALVNASPNEMNMIWANVHPSLNFREVEEIGLRHLRHMPLVPIYNLACILNELTLMNLVLGLATNDFEFNARDQLIMSGVLEKFDFICGYDSGYEPKPSASMVDAFADHSRLASFEVAMVGDSSHDMLAGRRAGVGLNIGVLSGPAMAQDLAQHADVIIKDISRLPSLLKDPD